MRLKGLVALLLMLVVGLTKPLAQQASRTLKRSAGPFVLGISDTIHSALLNEDRVINFYFPEGYNAKNAKTYPVLYLLDGSANEDFIHVVGLVQFLVMIGETPPTIVAGIANVDRRRDFSFPTTIEKDKKDFPTTGASKTFISFLDQELLPYVKQHYNVNDSSTLSGQSFGGLVATEILLTHPTMFQNYIIVSPSLWWNNESLLSREVGALKEARLGTVSVLVGNEGNQMQADGRKLTAMLMAANIKTNFSVLPEETHLTILHNALYKALTEMYRKSKTDAPGN